MFKTIRNAFKVKELRGKILYTFMMLVVIRFGCQLPIPGIETCFIPHISVKLIYKACLFKNINKYCRR